jgi:hypothetical protein
VVREELNESLSDHAGRAENAYVSPFHLTRISQAGPIAGTPALQADPAAILAATLDLLACHG